MLLLGSLTTAIPSTWTVVETAAALVSACLPTLGPCLRILKAKLGIQTSRKATLNTTIDLVTIGGNHQHKQGAQHGQHWSRSEPGRFNRIEEETYLDGHKDSNDPGAFNASKTSVSRVSGTSERYDGSGDEVLIGKTV
ncbi:uncharacterized protein BP5553_03136 [Venustampulla echinocandica]|uniref:Uncharacterized protein n=1 Tax=Venustampulla echinocandica TaxID=2656787 RepID=A0A370TTD6_9HELO|nr:uncharacterized protein BP5553_03136 [Venustampulla echinocandica]RDL38796.1 hypothetical protein BP5553_03136 [Venustampulla echinocandica]